MGYELDNKDKAKLKELGYFEEDFPYIERGCNVCEYYTYDRYGYLQKRNFDYSDAINRLGRYNWLSGIARATFHNSAMKNKGKFYMLFEIDYKCLQ